MIKFTVTKLQYTDASSIGVLSNKKETKSRSTYYTKKFRLELSSCYMNRYCSCHASNNNCHYCLRSLDLSLWTVNWATLKVFFFTIGKFNRKSVKVSKLYSITVEMGKFYILNETKISSLVLAFHLCPPQTV